MIRRTEPAALAILELAEKLVDKVNHFLLSDLASGVTAEITYVDGGFSHAMSGAVPEPAG